MEQSEYKEMFISEARDSLDRMNDVLLKLEKDPGKDDLIDELFRLFHTLKGNSASMGYGDFSELSHRLEDLLDSVRNKSRAMDEQIVDILLRGCDMLDKGLGQIEEKGIADLDLMQIFPDLEAIEGSGSDDPKTHVVDKLREFSARRRKGQETYVIVLAFDRENSLKGAKTLIVKRDLEEIGSVLEMMPPLEEVKLGRIDDKVKLIFRTGHPEEEITKIAGKITGIKNISVHRYEIDDSSTRQKLIQHTRSVKVNIKSLDNLMNMVGELLINKIRLEEIAKRHGDQELDNMIASLDRLIIDIQDEVMKERMIPIGNIFNRFPRMVRDLAKKQGKKVSLVIHGEDIEFDRTVLDEIGDPLVHLLRNSLDHGIETPEERARSGKPEEGVIELIARKDKSNAVIEVNDDGRGINIDDLKAVLLKKEIITESDLESMDDKAILKQLFRPGVSTKDKVTEISGRGVGMDVVENKVKLLGGNVRLISEPGKGTKVALNLPLTLAIINSLLVDVDDMRYAIPLSAINRTINIRKEQIRTIHGNEVFILNSVDIPLLRLSRILHNSGVDDSDIFTVVVVEKDDNQVGLVVDDIVAQQQILIKSLDDNLKGIRGIGGATILGDGRVALILDIASILE